MTQSVSFPLPAATVAKDLDELPRRIIRAWMVWRTALDANISTEGLDGIVPTGSGLVLFALYKHDGWTVGELAQRGHVSHVAVLHLIEHLEQAGLVSRKPCPKHGRATRVWLTQRGRDLESRMNALHERNLETLVRVLGEGDAMRLGALLGCLIEGLADHIKKTPKVSAQKTKDSKRT